jgi:hypothetical protein
MEKEEARLTAPGLKWIKRKASHTPVWVATAEGYTPRTVNLGHLRSEPDKLAARCASLQAEMQQWKAGVRKEVGDFDGTIGALLKRYQADPESPYHALRPSSRKPYDHYLEKLIAGIGQVRLDAITGVDLIRWHKVWSDDGTHLAASKMQRAVLDSAVTFGIMCRLPGCADLREVMRATSRKLPGPKRRESVVSADDVIKMRAAAHAAGRPSAALAYALVFETTLRLWDVIGQWWPMDAPLIRDVLARGGKKKWFGIRWEDISDDMVLRYMPSKTSAKTGLTVTFPLNKAPMVIEELAHWPVGKRTGPIIVSEHIGLPYSTNRFSEVWRLDANAAGLPKTAWARDLRASGITEARAADVSTDDAAKVAGHASTKTTAKIYDRANLEAAGRFADARVSKRKKKEG